MLRGIFVAVLGARLVAGSYLPSAPCSVGAVAGASCTSSGGKEYCCPRGIVPVLGSTSGECSCYLPNWQVGTFGTCSAGCGGGNQTRPVTCAVPGTTLADSKCDPDAKPATSRNCNTHSCAQCDDCRGGVGGICTPATTTVQSGSSVGLLLSTWRPTAPGPMVVSFLVKAQNPNTRFDIKFVSRTDRSSPFAAASLQDVSCARFTNVFVGALGVSEYELRVVCRATDDPSGECALAFRQDPDGSYTSTQVFGSTSACSPLCGPRATLTRTRYTIDPYANADTILDREDETVPCPQLQSCEYKTEDWSLCSEPCGGGTQRRNVLCVDSLLDLLDPALDCKGLTPPDAEQACNTQTCPDYVWKQVNPGACNKPCGGGTQPVSIVCFETLSNTTVDASFCSGQQPAAILPCNNLPCRWSPGDFGACSKPCGGGEQRRALACQDVRGVQVATSFCPVPPPVSLITCNEVDCSWTADSVLAPCDGVCGGGPDVSIGVTCVAPSGAVVGDQYCTTGPKPEAVYSCDPGVRCQWSAGSWEDCSTSCGGGEETRGTTCATKEGLVIPPTYCSEETQPDRQRACETQTCSVAARWVAGPWSACSAPCGSSGTLQRTVSCLTPSGAPSRECRTIRPLTVRTCNDVSCDWYAGPWRACSVGCGGGTTTRDVFCANPLTIEPAGEGNCTLSTRPATSMACNTASCDRVHRWQTGGWEECSVACGGGLQARHVGCVNTATTFPAPYSDCSGSGNAPAPTAACNLQTCTENHWKLMAAEPIEAVLGYGRCSAQCGGGRYLRPVQCVSANGEVLTSLDDCPGQSYPSAPPGTCNAAPCVETSSSEYYSVDLELKFPGVTKASFLGRRTNSSALEEIGLIADLLTGGRIASGNMRWLYIGKDDEGSEKDTLQAEAALEVGLRWYSTRNDTLHDAVSRFGAELDAGNATLLLRQNGLARDPPVVVTVEYGYTPGPKEKEGVPTWLLALIIVLVLVVLVGACAVVIKCFIMSGGADENDDDWETEDTGFEARKFIQAKTAAPRQSPGIQQRAVQMGRGGQGGTGAAADAPSARNARSGRPGRQGVIRSSNPLNATKRPAAAK